MSYQGTVRSPATHRLATPAIAGHADVAEALRLAHELMLEHELAASLLLRGRMQGHEDRIATSTVLHAFQVGVLVEVPVRWCISSFNHLGGDDRSLTTKHCL